MENIENTPSGGMRNYMPQEEVSNSGDSTPEASSGAVTTPSQVPTAQPVTPQQETFAENFDPNKLPPELLPAYKQMQGDYTRKTQGVAEIRERADSYQKYEKLIDFLSANPKLADQLFLGGGQPEVPVNEEPANVEVPTDPVEFANWIQEQVMAKVQETLKEQDAQKAMQIQVDADIAQAESLDPRLKSDENFATFIAGRVMADPAVRAGQKSMAMATKEAIDNYDAMVKTAVDAERARLTKEAQVRRNPTVNPSPSNVVNPNARPKTMREAAAEFLN